MSAAPSTRGGGRRRGRRGSLMLELVVAVVIAGLILATVPMVMRSLFRALIRMQHHALIKSQVEPVRALFAGQVARCSWVVYRTFGDARTDNRSALVTRHDTRDGDVFIRCDRRDGRGAFIVAYLNDPPDGGHGGIFVAPSTSAPATGFATDFLSLDEAIPLSRGISRLTLMVTGRLTGQMWVPASPSAGWGQLASPSGGERSAWIVNTLTRSESGGEELGEVAFQLLLESNF